MLTIDLGTMEYFDPNTGQFHQEEVGKCRFEYSLKVLYEWEGKWKKPFMSGKLTDEETIDFYMMMALDPIKRKHITTPVMQKLSDYVSATHTATKFSTASEVSGGNSTAGKSKHYTAEELYALMFMAGVPIEFENRNINRLLTILRVISNYNSPPKKMSREDIIRQNRELNAERKRKLKTKG